MIRVDTKALRWLAPYFGASPRFWALAVLATIVSSASEPLVPALMKPLLDRGFQPGAIQLWMVPASLLLLFAVRGIAGFIADMALARITQDGLLALRKAMFARLLRRAPGAVSRAERHRPVQHRGVRGAERRHPAGQRRDPACSRTALTLVALLAYLLVPELELTLIVFVIVSGVAWLIMQALSKRLYRIARSPRPPPTTWPTWSRKTCWPRGWCACTAARPRRPGASPRSARRCGASP